MRAIILLLTATTLATAFTAQAADWTFQVHSGVPWIPDRNIHIEQAGQPDIDLDASMIAKPFELPFYYELRLGRWDGDRGWAVAFLHHKLILDEPTAEVQDFRYTHGYNMVSLQRLWNLDGTQLIAGAGVVVTHTENMVRGQVFDEHGGVFDWGYYISGPLLVAGAARNVPLGDRLYLSFKLLGSWSHVKTDVVGGHATMTDWGAHLLGGVGYTF